MELLLFGFEYAHPEKEKPCIKNTGRDKSRFLDQSSVIGETVEEFVFGFEFARPEKAKGQTVREVALEERR